MRLEFPCIRPLILNICGSTLQKMFLQWLPRDNSFIELRQNKQPCRYYHRPLLLTGPSSDVNTSECGGQLASNNDGFLRHASSRFKANKTVYHKFRQSSCPMLRHKFTGRAPIQRTRLCPDQYIIYMSSWVLHERKTSIVEDLNLCSSLASSVSPHLIRQFAVGIQGNDSVTTWEFRFSDQAHCLLGCDALWSGRFIHGSYCLLRLVSFINYFQSSVIHIPEQTFHYITHFR